MLVQLVSWGEVQHSPWVGPGAKDLQVLLHLKDREFHGRPEVSSTCTNSEAFTLLKSYHILPHSLLWSCTYKNIDCIYTVLPSPYHPYLSSLITRTLFLTWPCPTRASQEWLDVFHVRVVLVTCKLQLFMMKLLSWPKKGSKSRSRLLNVVLPERSLPRSKQAIPREMTVSPLHQTLTPYSSKHVREPMMCLSQPDQTRKDWVQEQRAKCAGRY